VSPLQERIAVHVDYFNGRQGHRSTQSPQLTQHLIAELTVVAMDDSEALVHVGRAQ
jgi:hypothetical protein